MLSLGAIKDVYEGRKTIKHRFEAAAFNGNNEFKQRNNRWRFDKQEKMELLLSTK